MTETKVSESKAFPKSEHSDFWVGVKDRDTVMVFYLSKFALHRLGSPKLNAWIVHDNVTRADFSGAQYEAFFLVACGPAIIDKETARAAAPVASGLQVASVVSACVEILKQGAIEVGDIARLHRIGEDSAVEGMFDKCVFDKASNWEHTLRYWSDTGYHGLVLTAAEAMLKRMATTTAMKRT